MRLIKNLAGSPAFPSWFSGYLGSLQLRQLIPEFYSLLIMMQTYHRLKGSSRRLFMGLLSALIFPALSLSAFDLYWTEQKRILAADIDGNNETVIFDGETSSPAMASFAVDIAVTDSHIYWSGHDGGDIWRANRDGSDPIQLVPNAGNSIHFLAISEGKNHLYFTDFNNGIAVSDLDGSNTQMRDASGNAYTGLAMAVGNTSADELLVLTATDNKLRRFLPDQWWSPDEADLPDSSIQTYGLAFDPETQNVYYTNFGNGTLNVFNLGTKVHQTFMTPGMTQPLGVKLSPSGTHLLIAERGRGISGFQLDNGGYELIIESENAHFGVAVTADPGHLAPPPPPPVGTVLWRTDFEEDALGELPQVSWTPVPAPREGVAQVVQDTENVFGFGAENRILRADQVVRLELRSKAFSFPAEVVTFSYDFIGYFKEGDGRWLQAMIMGSSHAHITSIRMSDETIRGAPSQTFYGGNGIPVRLETILNNSTETITYEDPAGNEHSIRSTEAALWAYHHTTGTWELLIDSYVYTRNIDETGPVLNGIYILADGNDATRTFDLDNIEVRLGPSFSDLEGDVILPPVAEDGEILWASDFESDTAGELPSEGWTPVAAPGEGSTVHVATDTENAFGFGTDNQFLRVDGAFSFTLTTEKFRAPTDVLTLSFDFIGRFKEGDGRWLNVSPRAGGTRTHVTSLAMPTATLRGAPGAPSYGGNDLPVRIETVMNNSEEMITYLGPDGRYRRLESGTASVWAYHHTLEFWEQLADSYNYAREDAGPGQILDNIQFLVDGGSGTLRRFDMDNIVVTNGAHLSDLEGEVYAPPFYGHLEVDFEGIPTGEITRENVNNFVHGNISGITLNTTYGVDGNPYLLVVEDTENRFGEGTDNQILRANGAKNWHLRAENNFNEEVMTFRIDMIAEQIDGARLMSRFSDGGGNVISQIDFDAREAEGTFRNFGPEGPVWPYGTLLRFEIVVNNSFGPIHYRTPIGIKELVMKGTDIWINGELVLSNYTDSHDAFPGPIMSYEMRSFSTNPWDGDIGLIRTLAGAQLVGAEAGTGFADWAAENFPGVTDPAIVGPEADPDGDGIANLLEYALGLDPLEAGRAGLPIHGIQSFDVSGDEGNYLTLSVTSPDGVSDISFEVMATSDLAGSAEPAVLESVTPNGDGTSTYLYRDVEPVDVSNRRFLQLEVTLTE